MLEKFHLKEEGGIKILGTEEWEKLGGGKDFFPSSRGGLTLGDIMHAICEKAPLHGQYIAHDTLNF